MQAFSDDSVVSNAECAFDLGSNGGPTATRVHVAVTQRQRAGYMASLPRPAYFALALANILKVGNSCVRTVAITMHPSFMFALCVAFASGCSQAAPKSATQVPIVDTSLPASAKPDVDIDGPRIRATLTEIELNDRVLEWNPASVDRFQNIKPLFDALNALRAAKPKALQSGECAVDIARDMPFVAAVSVLQTSAFAGCPTAWVSTGSSWIKLHMPFPRPPDAASKPDDKPSGRRQLALHLGANQINWEIFAVRRAASRAVQAGRHPRGAA